MDTAQTLELRLAKTLHADRNAVNTRTLIAHEAVCFYRSGIRFHGNFRIGRQRQARTHTVQQRLHRLT
ncbi:hypothetical protein D3C75_825130 [compost metagenome]